jgi:transposase
VSGADRNEFAWFVGIDWATAAHQLCVLDAAGTVLKECVVEHTASALAAFVESLLRLTDGSLERVAIGIEMPRGAVVETLMERGAAIFTLNPKQVDRFRDRFTMAGAKDDRRDALVIAGALRTDRVAFRRVRKEDPRLIQLRELARADEDLAHEFNRLSNRLREQVYRIVPEWLTLSPSATDPWFWDLLEKGESPAQARQLKPRVIERLLRTHRIRRVTAEQVRQVLQRPTIHVAPGTAEAALRHIALLLPRLRLVSEQRRQCARELDALLETLSSGPPNQEGDRSVQPPSDIAIARSVPGVGRMVVATLFAEAGALIDQRNHAALRSLGGLAPVTKRSGRSCVVSMRYACNHRLRDAFYHWSRTATQFDPRMKSYYASLRSRGHTHGRALRSVADHGLRVLLAMLRTKTLFDPAYGQLESASA